MDAVVGVKQSVNNAFWCLENGAVLVQYRYFHLLRNILKFHEVFGEMGTKVLQAITVVVYQPTTIHLAGRRTFHHLASEGLRGFRPRTVGRLGIGHLDVTFRTGVVLQDHHIVVLASFYQCCVNTRESWVYHQLRRRKGLEVLRGSIIQTVVVLVVFQCIREFAWNARCPDDDGLLLHIVPEQLWSPYIDRCRVWHHLDETLLAPVLQVLRTGVAEPSVATP